MSKHRGKDKVVTVDDKMHVALLILNLHTKLKCITLVMLHTHDQCRKSPWFKRSKRVSVTEDQPVDARSFCTPGK